MVLHFPVLPGSAIRFNFGNRLGPPSRTAGETYTVKGPSLQPNGSPRHSAPIPPQDVYACKVIRRPLTAIQATSEIQRIEKVSAKRNKWVIRLYTTWQEVQTTGPARFLVMEVADKSLEEHMDYLARSYDIWEGFSRWFANDADCQVPFRDILNGLQYLHGLDIVHKNLKPSNVLLKRGQNGNFQIKISDFSFVSDGAQSNIPYSAPEILPPHSEYSPKSDIWAYVCIVYEWELCCFDRRKAFPTETAIKAFIFSGANPPHISWESLGVNRAAIPMGLRSREEEILGSWEVPNAEFRLCFKRDVGERPDVGELIDRLNGWYDKRRVDI